MLRSRRLSSVHELLTTDGIAIPVVAQVPYPVAVIREPETSATEPPVVVVGVDGSPRSAPAVTYAFEEAGLRDAEPLLRGTDVETGPTP